MRNSLFSIFNKYQNLVIALSQKQDGLMKLSGDSLRDKEISENRKRFLNKLGVDSNSLVSANLIHANTIQTVATSNTGKTIAKTDGLIADNKNLFLSITVADCLPIFLYDFEKEIVGLIHGGWRSLAKDILPLAIRKLTNDFNSKPENILAGIGPGISQCHYEVKEDILTKFKSFPSNIFIKRNGKTFLDLKKVAELQLLNCGVKKKNIEVNPECTYCLSNKYFSYRRDKSEVLETMIAAIGTLTDSQ